MTLDPNTPTPLNQVSPDGLWIWNGAAWVPNAAQPAPIMTKSRKGMKILGGTVAALLVLGIASSLAGGTDSGDPATTASTQTQDQVDEKAAEADGAKAEDEANGAKALDEAEDTSPEPETEDAVAGIGDKVADGKFTFTVTGVKAGVDSVGSEYLREKAQGSFTLVTMKVKNTGDEPQTFFSDNIKGVDSKGRKVAADSEASYAASNDPDVWIEEINPGNSITVTVAFDLAKGAKLTTIEVHDSVFSGGADIALT